jgi:hypothetical protein
VNKQHNVGVEVGHLSPQNPEKSKSSNASNGIMKEQCTLLMEMDGTVILIPVAKQKSTPPQMAQWATCIAQIDTHKEK